MNMKQETINELKKLTCRYLDQNETISVLKSELLMFLSWGVSKGVRFQDTGLLLKVNGHHHKGWVFITLNGSDLYNVHLLNNRYRVLQTITDIYFTELCDTIDENIERIPEYNR